MMDIQVTFALIFFAILAVILVINRKKITTEGIFPLFYFSMYKTKLGLETMDRYARRHRKFFLILSKIGIVVGFLGMIFISGMLVYYLIKTMMQPQIPSGVQIVLPFKIEGTFYVPFFYWITCLTIIAFIHEFSHGVIARLHKVKIKSSGVAFLSILLPIIPAAFVEPDENKLRKKKKSKQLGVLAAGPFSNIILAIIALLFIFLVFRPVNDTVYQPDGVLITSVQEGFGAFEAGVGSGEVIQKLGEDKIFSVNNLTNALDEYGVGDNIDLITNASDYDVKLSSSPSNESFPYLGVTLQQSHSLKEGFGGFSWFFSAYDWFAGLFFWLFVLNLGVGLFNLAPLVITDGGRMLQIALYYVFPNNEKKADKLWKVTCMFFLGVVLALVLSGFF